MLNIKIFYVLVLFLIFWFLFGFATIRKYAAKKTIVVKNIRQTNDIPSPGVIIATLLTKNDTVDCMDNLEPSRYFSCVEGNSYLKEELILNNEDNKDIIWNTQLLGSMLSYLSTSKFNMSTKLESSYKLELNPFFAFDINYFPGVMFFDPKYFMISQNYLTIPTLDLFPGDFLDSPNYILNLEVKKITRLNTNNNPCEAAEDYNMTACVGHYVAEKVGCSIPHNILYDESLKQCTAKEDLEQVFFTSNGLKQLRLCFSRKFFAIQDELVVLTKSELLETTQCLPPCSYYYYQLGNKAIGKEDGSGNYRFTYASAI